MGLAYDLDVQARFSLNDWQFILSQGDTNLFSGGSGNSRREGITIPNSDSSEFDVVIRKTTLVEDHYVICGSYRAFFDDLASGAGAYAWDGFITIIRAHNLPFVDSFDPAVGFPPPTRSPLYWLNPGFVPDAPPIEQPFSQTNRFWTYLARMPYEITPRLTGLGSDSTPGIYSVDTAKTGLAAGFQIIAGGHANIDTATEGGLTGQNYSAWIAVLEFERTIPQISPVTGTTPPLTATRPYAINFSASNSIQVSQNATTRIGTGLTDSNTYPGIAYNLASLARSVNQIPAGFSATPLTSLGNGYVLTRIHDVLGLNTGPIPIDLTALTLWITGESAYSDGAGSVDFTTPMLGIWEYEGQGSYTDLYVAVGDRNWATDGSVAAYDLDSAYGTALTPSFNVSATQDPLSNQVLVAVDRVTHGGSTNAEIYAANFKTVIESRSFLGSQQYCLWPFAVRGGAFETVGGFTLPDKWLGKAVQQKTFTQDEEEEAKNLTAFPNTVQPDGVIDLIAIEDRSLQQLLAADPTLQGGGPEPINYLAAIYPPNYLDYGLSNKPAFTGQPANIAYGFFGFLSGTGPEVFMYDFGTVTMDVDLTVSPPQFYVGPWATDPLKAGADIISVGSTMNSAIVTAAGSTTRRPVSAGWDVDRDQWVFTFADTTGGTVLSCNSAFDRQPATQVAYLDQTDQFPRLSSNTRSAYYTPRNMTPYLDGLVLFGGEVDTTQLGQATLKSVLLTDEFGNTIRGFQAYEIQGSTGRTARVWVDYMLYDGIDSLVAVVIQEMGLRVTVENVEWYKRKILNEDVLNMSSDEVEAWIDAQQAEYRKMLIEKERQGRLRRRRRQQSAIANDLEDLIQGEFVVSDMDFIEGDFMERNLRDLDAFPDQDSQLKRQILTDEQWLEGDTLYGSSVPRKKTASEKRKEAEKNPKEPKSDES